jgi:transglutaminase-like putative cysteine protease
MRIRYGLHIDIEIAQPTILLTAMDIERRRRRDLASEQPFSVTPAQAIGSFTDGFGNLRRRIKALPGLVSIRAGGVIDADNAPDIPPVGAAEVPVASLPVDALPFLIGSRYCETDLLSSFAQARFGAIEGGRARVEAVCDFVHRHLALDCARARATRTAAQALAERVGVCRDFAHLAVALCRCLNIPARYCHGYLGDGGAAPDPAPTGLNAWFEAYVGGTWRTFDACHDMGRIGRIVVARGRDAMDVPMLHTFGPHVLRRFEVITEQLPSQRYSLAAE